MTVAPPLVWLHLGLGAFHRAHQAVFLQRLVARGDPAWTLQAGNIRPDPDGSVAALLAQDGAYTLETVAADGERRYERIVAIGRVLPWDAALRGVRAVGADVRTRIVSFTVTEAGYGLDADGRLDLAAPDVAADLQLARAGVAGRTIYGALVAILRDRMGRSAGGVTLLCCDNLRHNGARLHAALARFIDAAGDARLLDWVRRHTTAPNTMVDRITPRPSPEVVARVRAATGVEDPAALMAESFIQWVIEDDFIAGRPAWEAVGVEMTASVAPYEEAKIRLLNAAHSCLGWAGTLAGHTFVHESARDPEVRGFAHDYATDDAIPALGPSPVDLIAYRDVALERFGNAALRDTLQRVTADSFAKLAGFVVPTVRDRLRRDEGIESVAMLPALFLAFLQRWRAGRLAHAWQEQPADVALAETICAAADPLAALAAQERVWGPLAGDPRLVGALRRASLRVDRYVAARAQNPGTIDNAGRTPS